MDVDLRLVRYFLVMAEELHFTAAARRLYVSQPALSNQIRRLESQLGAQLFNRSPRGVTLTAAGDAFLPHARGALDAIRSGVADATAAAERDQVLRIDVLQTNLATPRAVLARLRDRLPSFRLEITSRGTRDQQQLLLTGELDLAPEWNEFVLACCRTAGFAPRRHPASTTSVAELVRAGECVALGLLSTPYPEGVVVRPLAAGVPPYGWSLRWRDSPRTPAAALAVLRSLD